MSFTGTPDLALLGALLGDRARAAMLDALMGGGSLSATELAAHAAVTRATARSHLRRLLDGELVMVEPRGKRRLYSLAGTDVARWLETCGALAPQHRAWTTEQQSRAAQFRLARVCYDHLAGAFGVAFTEMLLKQRYLRNSSGMFSLSRSGHAWAAAFGLDVAVLLRGRRPLTRACLDVTERRPHLAGALGAAIYQRLHADGWIRRARGSRALHLSDKATAFLSIPSRPGMR